MAERLKAEIESNREKSEQCKKNAGLLAEETEAKKEELISLADGGLCQMCESCHWPNCTFGRY